MAPISLSSLSITWIAPPIVVGARNWITPAYELKKSFFPQPDWIINAAIHQKILPLPGHTASINFTPMEQMRVNRMGI